MFTRNYTDDNNADVDDGDDNETKKKYVTSLGGVRETITQQVVTAFKRDNMHKWNIIKLNIYTMKVHNGFQLLLFLII